MKSHIIQSKVVEQSVSTPIVRGQKGRAGSGRAKHR